LIAASLLRGPSTDLPSLEVLKAAVLEHRPVPPLGAHERSKIAGWSPKVKELLDKGMRPKVIWHRLREKEPDFEGSYSQVKRLCRALCREAGVRATDVAIPVVTLPGKEAQVDFGYVGARDRVHDPDLRRRHSRGDALAASAGATKHERRAPPRGTARLPLPRPGALGAGSRGDGPARRSTGDRDLRRGRGALRAAPGAGDDGLLETLPPEGVEAVCKRASFYGITRYGEIKRIVRKHLDAEPLPLAIAPGHGRLSAPRFARNLGERLVMTDDEEACHEPH